MDPSSANLDAFFADAALRLFDRRDRVDVRAGVIGGHHAIENPRYPLIVTLLGGSMRAFFRDGTLHHQDEEGEGGSEHTENEKAIEIGERG